MAGGHYRKIVKYCEAHCIRIPRSFHDTDPSKLVLIDVSIPQRPLLLTETFDYPKQITEFLRERNVHPLNYQVLNFKTGYSFAWSGSLEMTKSNAFSMQP